jgi:hypothetical protein
MLEKYAHNPTLVKKVTMVESFQTGTSLPVFRSPRT